MLIDDRLFARSRGSGSGPDVVTPILVNDNLVDVLLTPAAKAGEPATCEFRPQTAYVQIDVQVDTVAEGKPAQIEVERVGPQRFVVRGQIPPAPSRWCASARWTTRPASPGRCSSRPCGARACPFRASVHQAPTAELPEKDSYKDLTRVAVLKSPPLSEAVKVTLKVSHNLYASTLPLLVAAKYGKRTLPEGHAARSGGCWPTWAWTWRRCRWRAGRAAATPTG